jgi:hypothetical protein
MSESEIVRVRVRGLVGVGAAALSQCDSNKALRKGARALQSAQTT